jgi:hypothetical protein
MPSWCALLATSPAIVDDLHRDERRHGCQLLLSPEQEARRDPVAPSHSGQDLAWPHRVVDDPTLVIVAERASAALARRRIVRAMTNAMTKGVTKPMT